MTTPACRRCGHPRLHHCRGFHYDPRPCTACGCPKWRRDWLAPLRTRLAVIRLRRALRALDRPPRPRTGDGISGPLRVAHRDTEGDSR